MLRDPYWSEATIERHSTGTRQSTRGRTDAVPSVHECLCECACACVCASPPHFRACVFYVCVCGERVCAPRRCARSLPARRQRAVSIARPAPRALRPRARGCVRCHPPGSRASAAGVTWTSRTASAPWADRAFHTSVADAAGAIYVIGGRGTDSTTFYADVWASTDGGARPDSVKGGRGVLGGTQGY